VDHLSDWQRAKASPLHRRVYTWRLGTVRDGVSGAGRASGALTMLGRQDRA